MGTAYTEFSCLAQDLMTNLQTAILSSTDWSRPNSGTKPTLYKCTTTRGVQMCIDLADAALTAQTLSAALYRTHDGTTGVDKAIKYLLYKRNNTGALATNTIRVIVSAGKEHLFISVEGPRIGDATGVDNGAYGSMRQYIFLNDLVPYFDSTVDLASTIVAGGSPSLVTASAGQGTGSHWVHASRNMRDSAAWSVGKLATLIFPSSSLQSGMNAQMSGKDGNIYLAPYVFFDDIEGIRGRLASFFFAGYTIVDPGEPPPMQAGQIITYASKQYKLLPVSKSDGTQNVWGPLGMAFTADVNNTQRSPIVAVPYA